MEYTLVADSSCDLTNELRKEWNVKSVPLTLTLAEESYIDDDNLDVPDFMLRMQACKGRVGSAAPSPGLYADAFGTGEAFAVTLSSSLSGSYASAMAGKSMAEESGAKVHVFDSRSAAAAEVLIVMKIRKFIEEGLQRSEIIQKVEHFIKEMCTFFVLDNVENLRKNGRLNRITATIISTLHIRPIIGADADGNPVSLNALWLRRHTTKFNGVSYFVQRAAEAVYSNEGSRQINEVIAYYLNNAKIILNGLKEAGITAYGGVNSPYVWLKTPGELTSWEFFDLLLDKANVVGTPGSGFGRAGEGYFRLTAFNTTENTKKAMQRFLDLNL